MQRVMKAAVACGCCHTDVHAIDGDWFAKPKMPLCPGHEGVGVVVELGSNTCKTKIGQRVGIAWLHSACGSCEFCKSGWETQCPKQQNSGYSVDGCYAEYAIGSDAYVIPIPDSLDSTQAAPILCAGVTSYKAIKRTEAAPGEFIAIVGAGGGLGHLGIQYAKAMGLRVIAVDRGADKHDFCKSLGAEKYFDATAGVYGKQTIIEKVQEYTKGGSHGVLCLATQNEAFTQSIGMCRSNGTIVCVGLPAGSFEVPVLDMVSRGLTIRGSYVGSRQDAIEALDFAAKGLVKCTVETAKLDDINDVIERLRENQVNGRVVLEF